MGTDERLDPEDLPNDDGERKRLADALAREAMAAFAGNQPLVASLKISDALLLAPNDRDLRGLVCS